LKEEEEEEEEEGRENLRGYTMYSFTRLRHPISK